MHLNGSLIQIEMAHLKKKRKKVPLLGVMFPKCTACTV